MNDGGGLSYETEGRGELGAIWYFTLYKWYMFCVYLFLKLRFSVQMDCSARGLAGDRCIFGLKLNDSNVRTIITTAATTATVVVVLQY